MRSTVLGLWLGGLLGALTLACAAPAQAGQYTVWSCRGPGGTPIPTSAWRTQSEDAAAGDIAVADDCAGGGSLRIEATPGGTIFDHHPAVEALFEPPAGTFIPSFKIWRYAAADDGPNTPAGESDYSSSLREWLFEPPPELAGEGLVNECALGHAPRCSFGTPVEPLAGSNLVTEHTWTGETVPGEGVQPLEKIGFWVSCLRLGCEPPAAGEGPAAVFELFRSAITIEDDHAPVVERLEGSLTEAAPLSGTGHLLVTAGDVGGGIAGFEFSVDGGPPRRVSLADGKGGCEEPFAEARPCPGEATRDLAVDTGALTPGVHTVSGSVVDAAGNSTRFGPITFTVAAPPVEPLVAGGTGQGAVAAASAEGGPNNGTPAVEAPRLQLREVPGAHPAGKAGRLGGTLTTPSGEPIKGASLGVEITELGARHQARKLQIRTDQNGRFELAVGGTGARTVVVSYAPTVGGPASRSADTVLKTPLALSLTPRPRAVRTGQTVHFLGRLSGAGGAAQGANVEIQAITGGHWTTIDTVTVGRHGSFSWAHRFRYVERDALFSFRAVVPSTPGWPWQTVRSRRIKLPIEGAPR